MKHTHTWNDQYDACYYTDCLTIWIKQKSCFVFAQMVALAGGAAFFCFPILLLRLLLQTKIRLFFFAQITQVTIAVSWYAIMKPPKKGPCWEDEACTVCDYMSIPFGRVGENRCQWKSSLRSLDCVAIGLLHNNCTMTSWNHAALLWICSDLFFVQWFNQIWIVRCLNSTSSRRVLCWALARWLWNAALRLAFPSLLHRHISTNNFRTL